MLAAAANLALAAKKTKKSDYSCYILAVSGILYMRAFSG